MQRLGRYEILEELGHGAMGTVYRARDPEIDRIVALKTVRVIGATPEQEAEYRRRFFREAQSAGKLSHRGIVTIYDVGEDKATQTPYIVMEYIEGHTLESFLTDPALPSPSLAASLKLIQQVAEALDYAHTHEIVHRDIKPANILVTPDGQPKITDFGIAKLRKSEFTVPGQILGTLAYLAPEQLKGIPVDGRADLFSLGVVLYWMLTGRKPFEGDTSTIVYQVACVEPPPVTDLNPEIPPEVNRVVSRSLAKDPALRYQRGMEFAEDLEDMLAGRAPRWTSETPLVAATEKTVVESRPLAPPAMEKTFVERRGAVSATHPHPAAGSSVRHASELVAQLYRRASVRGRVAVAAGILLLLLLPFLFQRTAPGLIRLTTPSVPLRIESQHSFRSAELSIWVDGSLVHQAELTGVAERRLFRTSVRGSYAESLGVPAGERVVRVRVRSKGDGYDQTREATVEFQRDRIPTLVLGFNGRGRNLTLSWIE
jgi:serine/threonine-protein kinase